MTQDQNQRVSLASVDILVTLALVGLYAYISLQLVMPFTAILAWTAILAIALYLVFQKFSAMLGGRRGWTATILALFYKMIEVWTGHDKADASEGDAEAAEEKA